MFSGKSGNIKMHPNSITCHFDIWWLDMTSTDYVHVARKADKEFFVCLSVTRLSCLYFRFQTAAYQGL